MKRFLLSALCALTLGIGVAMGQTSRDRGNGTELSMFFDWPDFTGQRWGLFYFPTKQLGGYADFDFFHVE